MSTLLLRRGSVRAGLLSLALGAGLAFSGAVAAETNWDLPLAWPDGNFHVENAKRFAEDVKKVTDGEVVINIHSGGSLGFKGPEMWTAIRDGLVPIGDSLLNSQTGTSMLAALEAQPYLVEDYDELRKLHKHFRPALEEEARKFNQKILYVVPWPRQYVYTKEEAKDLGDLKGVKIRTYNASTTDMFNRIGMTAVQLPWGEVVPALAAGTIASVTTSASSGVDGKFWEFLKYMYPTSHVWSSNSVSVNLDAWNALEPEHQKAIEDLARRLEPEFWEISDQDDAAKVKILTENGIIMGDVPDAMLAEMKELTKPIVENYMKTAGPQASAVIEAYWKDAGS